MAYESNEGGRYEVYIRSFPALGSRDQVSLNGGIRPVWSRSGHELFFRLGADVYVARVRMTGAELDIGTPQRLPVPPRILAGEYFWYTFDVAPDGRLLLIQDNTPPSTVSLNIVSGWLDELARRVPLGK
jgi:hypothetical protein